MASFEGNGEKEKAPLAQIVERSAHNRVVVGSSPTRRDIMNIFDYYEYNNIRELYICLHQQQYVVFRQHQKRRLPN